MQRGICRYGRGRHDTRGRVLLLTVLLALVAILGGRTAAVAASTIFEDNFDVAFEGWMTSGSPDWYSDTPKNGTHSIQLRKNEAIERLVPTIGYTDITVSFALGASSLDRSTEVVRALWYDGSQWGVLHAIAGGDAEEDGQLHTFSLSLPPGAGDNAYFRLRFEIVGNNTNDYGYVDDVLVSGELPVRTLTVDGQGTGSIRVDGVDYDLPWSGDFSPGASVTLEAVPGACWAFAGWEGDLGGSDNPVVVVLDTDKAVTADFSQLEYTLTLDAVGTGSLKVDGELVSLPWSGQYACGTNVTLEGVPVAGWTFGSWGGDVSSTNPSVVVTMDAPKNITATFSQESYTLSLAKVGSGSANVNGTLRSLPWSGSFLSDTSVTLEAVPASGWKFDGWSGDATWSGATLTVTMDAPKNITATFSQESYTLSLAKVGSGSANVNGTLRSLPWSGSFLSDTSVTLEAVPASGWKFDGWSGDATWSGATLTVTMDAPKNITATFSQESYTLSLAKVGSGSANVNGTLRALPWSGSFLSGTSVTLEAVPASGWKFDGWSGDATWSGAALTVTMDAPKNITATFSQESYTLSLAKVGSGSVKVDGTLRALPWSGSFLSGTSVTLEAVPDSGWEFDGWSGDATWSGATLVLSMDAPKNITATFSQESYTLSLAKVGSGSAKVNGTLRALSWSGSFLSGASVALEAVPASGWKFDGWSGDATWSGATLIVTMNASKNLTATFSQESYTLSLAKVGSGSVKVNGTLRALPWSGSFLSGTSVTLEAVPASGWKFDGWSGDATWSGATLSVTMNASKNLTATFSQDGHVLNLSKIGSGSAKVNGTLRSLPWSGSFLSGASVALEAVPASGWEFDGWSGDATWSGSVLYVTMDDDKDLTANFEERDLFILSLSKTGAGAVTVNGMAVSLPWSGELPRGSDVTLHAVPDEGWRFNHWSGDLSGSQNPTAITMNGDWDIIAKFAEIQCDLSITGVGAGAVKVNGDLHSLPWSGEFTLGTQITLEAVPDSGWDFGGWSGDLSGESNPAVFAMDGDRSVTATFVAPDQFQLTVTKSGSGSVTVDGVERSLPWSGLFANGAQVTVEAVAEIDEQFVEWSGDVTGSANPITLTMDSDKSVKAEFACTAGPFSDVPCGHWAAEAIAAVHDADIASGYSDGCYLPGLALTRAAMAVFLARGLAGGTEGVPAGPEEPTFSDVPTDHWAFAEVEYVVSKSIAEGYGDGSYQPAWQITRGQMAAFVARSVAEPTGEEGLATFDAPEAPSFSDVPASMWCYRHVEYLADLGIVTGYSDGLYRPGATVTRDQMAVYVARAFDLLD